MPWDPTDPDRPDILRVSRAVLARRTEGRFYISCPYHPEVVGLMRQTIGAVYDPSTKTWRMDADRIERILVVMERAREILASAGLDDRESFTRSAEVDWDARPYQILPHDQLPGVGEKLSGRFKNRIVERIGEPFDPPELLALLPAFKGKQAVKVWHRAMTVAEYALEREIAPDPGL